MNHLFCFGFGYTAKALARVLMAEGWCVTGTCRDREKANALKAQSITPVLFDGTAPIAGLSDHLRPGTCVLASIPPDDDGDPVIRLHGEELADRAASLPWVGYLSSTGVYGDRSGDWVDETSDYMPSTQRGRLRLRAERQWNRLYAHRTLCVHRFRLAGIYGPGRNQLDRVRKGTAQRIEKPGQVFSRIHVDDIAHVLRASIRRPAPGRAYNVCDDLPAPPQDVVAFAAELLDVAVPPLVSVERAALSTMAASFYAENKRVRNDRIKRELGVDLVYPTYREGLQSLVESRR